VYATLALDHPAVWDDDGLLAWWVRLLRMADDAYPGPAPIPRALPDDFLDALIKEGIIEPHGNSAYRFHGLAEERAGRKKRGSAGGRARADHAGRDPLGRFAGADAGESRSDAGDDAGALAGPAKPPPSEPSPPLDRWAAQRTQRDETSQDEGSTTALRLGSVPAPVAPTGRGAPTAGTIRCDDYHGHQTTGHTLIPGVGWRCTICEAKWAAEDESFSEKARRYGAQF